MEFFRKYFAQDLRNFYMNKKTYQKRLSFFDVAFYVLLAVFVVTALFSFCSFKSTGKSFTYQAKKDYVAVYEVEGSTAKVKTVYVNIGSVYTNIGENALITVKRSANKTTKPSVKFGDEQLVGNIYSANGKGESGKLFNWLVFDASSEKTTGLLSITADKNVEINEIVCVDKDGKQIPLSVNKKYTTGYKDAKNAVDAQNSFRLNSSVKYNFTEEEAYTLTAVNNMLLGDKYTENSVYHVDGRFNTLATALYLPAVATFGVSTGALRITSLFYTALALVFLYHFAKLLLKDDKSAFILALFTVFGGLAFTSGVVGVAYAVIFFALSGSAYCMYRFFSQGVSSQNPVKTALPVLYSGVLGALAIAIDVACAIPVAGVLALFLLGLRRQKTAYSLTVEKITQNDKEETADTEKAVYQYKNKLCIGYASIGFVIATFILWLLGGILGYSSYVRAYDNPADPTMGFASILAKGIKTTVGANLTKYIFFNATVPAGWFIPWKAATFYQAGDNVLTWSAFINPVLTVSALVSVVYCAVKVGVDFKNKENGKSALRLRRIFFVLVAGTLLTCFQSSLTNHLSTAFALWFTPFYFAFIPLALKTLSEKNQKLSDILLCVLAVAVITVFTLSIPASFGFEVAESGAKFFQWITPRANGFFR